MSLSRTGAAKQWLKARAAKQAAERLEDEAANVLKPYFRETGETLFRGVQYSRSSYVGIDHELVKQVLGKRLDEVQVQRVRETLSAAA